VYDVKNFNIQKVMNNKEHKQESLFIFCIQLKHT